MTQRNHQIRSKEVQEMLTSPPNLLILWGNIFIIVFLLCFIFMLDIYRVPVSTQLPFKTISIRTDPIKRKIYLNVYFNTPIPPGFVLSPNNTLTFQQLTEMGFGSITAKATAVSYIKNETVFCIKSNHLPQMPNYNSIHLYQDQKLKLYH